MGKASREKKARYASTQKESGVKDQNWFAIVITSLAGLLITGVAIFAFVGNAEKAKPAPAPSSNVNVDTNLPVSVDQDSGAVIVGKGKVVLDEYLDFGCIHCKAYYAQNGEGVKKFAVDDQIQLRIHPLGMLDAGFQGTKFSTRAANAFYCVASESPSSIFDFMGAMFANQPSEGTPGLSDDRIIEIAKNAGADAAKSCIVDQTYSAFVTQQTRAALTSSWFEGTPLIRLNGETINSSSVLTSIQGALN